MARLARSPVILSDFTDHLVWPRLLRAAGLALAPHRIGLCAMALVLVMLLDQGWRITIGHPPPAPPTPPAAGAGGSIAQGPISVFAGNVLNLGYALVMAVRDLNPTTFSQALGDLFLGLPVATLHENQQITPAAVVSAFVLLPLALFVVVVFGGAVSRSVACQFAHGKAPGWPQSLGYALGRWRSLLGAVLGPLVAIWALMGITAGVGRLLFSWPFINTVGALVLPLGMLVCLFLAVLCAAYAFGHLLLGPAVACDDADAFDAVQRAYAYTLAKPLRLLIYTAIMLAQGLLAALLVRGLVVLTMGLVAALTHAPLDATPSQLQSADADDWFRRAAAISQFWAGVVGVLATAYVVSFYFTASTLVYLAMRNVCDKQDMAEVWLPRDGDGAGV